MFQSHFGGRIIWAKTHQGRENNEQWTMNEELMLCWCIVPCLLRWAPLTGTYCSKYCSSSFLLIVLGYRVVAREYITRTSFLLKKTIIAILLYHIMLYMEIMLTLQLPLFFSPLWNHTTFIKGPTLERLIILAYPVLPRLPKSVDWLLFPWNNLKYCILFQKQIEPGIPKELEMKAISRKTKSCWL